jgi:hypothetical protein
MPLHLFMFNSLKSLPTARHRIAALLGCGLASLMAAAVSHAQTSAPATAPATTNIVTMPTPPAKKPMATKPAAVTFPEDAGLQSVALLDFGATAKESGTPMNADWPANGTLAADAGRGGVLMGGPLTGGRIDIRIIIPVDLKAIEVTPLDYHGTQQPKTIDIFVDGKPSLKDVQLPHNPGVPFRIPLVAHAQNVGILITDSYPPETPDEAGKKPTDYGGWSRLRVIASTDVASQLKAVENYSVATSQDFIEATSNSSTTNGKVKVVGQPRQSTGHPNTLWDKEDVEHYKKMLTENKELKAQFDGLQKALDLRMTQPIDVPQGIKNEKGEWSHLSDAKTDPVTNTLYGAVHNQLCLDIANLGIMWQLTGDNKYADFAKKILLAYADAYPTYGIGARPGFAHAPSVVYDQVLGDAIWFVPLARGYDFIHDYTGITPDERKHIEDDFIKPEAKWIVQNHSMLEASTNWSAIGTSAVLTAGYATDDQDLINTALYGINGTADKPTGGLYDRHFSGKAIQPDGLWVEGAMGYQFMALQALVMDAETLWHHNIDMYSYRDGALKRLFDSPIQYSYPDLTTPAMHDSHHGSILGVDSFLYEYAYRRYQDPAYVPILNQVGRHLDTHYQQFPVSVLYDRDRDAKSTPPEWTSENFFDVGYGILRLTTPKGINSVLLAYGPEGSHSHPDELTLDIYALNGQLMVAPGSIWYELPLYHHWYHTTFAHPTMTIDELDQQMTIGGKPISSRQLVYGSADTMGIQRASNDESYPGVTMDRSVFLTANYVGDLFAGFAKLPRKMDLTYHIRGKFSSDLPLEAWSFPEPVENGYNSLTNVRHTTAPTSKPWSATLDRDGNIARFVAAGGTPTEVIVGDGHYELETPPTIVERRTVASTIFGNAIDISGTKDGYVKSVAQEGGLDAGYGLLKVTTPKGVDLCFASYRPGNYQDKAGNLQTDALQALVQMDGAHPTAFYLGGGKTLKVGKDSIQRSAPGLAYIEKADTGGYVVANPSSSDTTIIVALPALKGMEAYALDSDEQRTGPLQIDTTSGTVSVPLKAGAKAEFAPKNATSIFAYRTDLLRKREEAAEAALAKAKSDCEARTKVAEAAAKANPAPANTILVDNAAAFTSQGGGEIKTSDSKRGAIGTAISSWDAEGHWLEWTFDAPADGYYNLSLCYCSELDQIGREISINGEVQEPSAPMELPTTGGYANGSDDWRVFTAINPTNDQPLLLKLKAGKNVIRLTNLNGRSANINYVAITSPDVKVTRDILAAKAPTAPIASEQVAPPVVK